MSVGLKKISHGLTAVKGAPAGSLGLLQLGAAGVFLWVSLCDFVQTDAIGRSLEPCALKGQHVAYTTRWMLSCFHRG